MSFNRSGYIGRAPGDSSIVLAKQYFQPTGAGKTFTFTAGYDPGLIDVYRNGVKLINVLDYAATDGSTIVLDTPVGVGSTVQVVAYKGFNLAEVNSSGADFNVGTNLYVQSGFGSFSQGITANQIDVSGIGTIGIGSFVDVNISGAATVAGTLVANSFSGDGSALTGLANTAYIVSVATTAGNLNVSAAATITGDLTVSDSIAVTKDLNVGAATTITGILKCTSTTPSTSTSTGGVVISGGLGVGADVYIGAGLSVAGTLTYEDVTSVDSVGMVTAKSGINMSGGEFTVGSGITMGIAGVTTYSKSSTYSGLNLRDNVKLTFGETHSSSDLEMFHDGTDGIIDCNVANLKIRTATTTSLLVNHSENALVATHSGSVDSYYNNTKRFSTSGVGATVFGQLDVSGTGNGIKVGSGITMSGSSGIVTFADGSTTSNALKFGSDGDLVIYHDSSESYIHDNGTGGINLKGSYVKGLNGTNEVLFNAIADGAVELYHNNVKTFETSSDGIVVQGTEGGNAAVYLYADEGDDNADKWQLYADDSGNCRLLNYASGSWETNWGTSGNGNVELYYDNSAKLATTYEGVLVSGMTSATAGIAVTGGFIEGAFIKAGKLSDNQTLGISTSNVFYFTTAETTTATPNIVWNDTYSLSSKMNVGDMITVNVITTAAAAGYAANWTIDGNAVTEVWVGGAAPSAGGSSGLDIYALTILKTGTGTGDSGFKVIANVTNGA